MSLVEIIVAVGLNAGAVLLLGWTTWTAFQARERPSGRSFSAICGMLTAWAIFTLVSELPEPSVLALISNASRLGGFLIALFIPAVLTVYALSYTGRGTGLTWGRLLGVVAILLPFGIAAIVVGVDPRTAVAEQAFVSLLVTEILLMLVLFLYATYLLVGLGRKTDRLSGRQMPILLLGVAAPYLGGAIGSGGTAIDGVTVGFIAAGGLLAVAVKRYPVLTGFPKAEYVARTRVVEALQEVVLVIDWDGYVLDANERAGELFARQPAELVGESIQSIVDGFSGTDLAAGTTGTVTLRTTAGRRQFQFSVSAVDDRPQDDDGTTPVARAVLLRDVTDRQTREERLTVLNRVLRHNVRNELDVVLAHAERVDDDELRSAIRKSATDLLEIGEKARESEAIMTASTETPERVDLTAVAETVAENYRSEYPGSEVSLACPDDLTISSHPAVVQQLLAELVENALAHNDTVSPSVEIDIREGADGSAELVVADNGPGIPDREQEVLSNGVETQLEHGRGMGLWLVNWAVAQLGGKVMFDETGSEGSVVTVRLYDTEYEA